jgi:hypothetical protein
LRFSRNTSNKTSVSIIADARLDELRRGLTKFSVQDDQKVGSCSDGNEHEVLTPEVELEMLQPMNVMQRKFLARTLFDWSSTVVLPPSVVDLLHKKRTCTKR